MLVIEVANVPTGVSEPPLVSAFDAHTHVVPVLNLGLEIFQALIGFRTLWILA